ncbi:MAG: hypothetical protein ACFFBD_04970, partial [Candidatus Hodarchaeota archaeon]
SRVDELGAEITNNLRIKAETELKERIIMANNWEELERAIANRMVVKIPFCTIEAEGEDCAMEIKEKLAATVRGIDVQELDANITPENSKTCLICGGKANCYIYIGKQY